MARPKAYNEESVLNEAMLCFWRRGYTATSMKNLELATGLTPGSLYNSFGSKDGLFLQALDHYIDKVVSARVEKHLRAEDPIEGIQDYVQTCFQSDTPDQGCLLINTSTEMGPHDEKIRRKVLSGMRVVEKGLIEALYKAQSQGRLDARVDPLARATQLGLLINGILVSIKVTKNKDWLNSAMAAVRGLLH